MQQFLLGRRAAVKQSGLLLAAAALTPSISHLHMLSSTETHDSLPALTRPFVAQVPAAALADLKARLAQTRWATALPDTGWDYGTNLPFLQDLVNYWAQEFDWRKVEAASNAYPNFTTDLDGHRIHFLHVKGKGPKTVPLLLTHGWPGSFLEMLSLIPLLTAAGPVSFDVVIPSLPGFGYSAPFTAPGGSSFVVADLWHQLMGRLGYSRYGAQGGDVGAGVSTWLALKYPASVIGLHLNYIPGSFKPYLKPGEVLSPEVIAFQKTVADWSAREGAYGAMHGTKPLTAAYGLNDSPVGLCAWIVEKFHGWSDHGPENRLAFTKEELLANVTLYWLTQTIYSSMAIYKENARRPLAFGPDDYVRVPVAFAQFPKELPTPPRAYVEKGFNIQRWTPMPAGGHFAALEQPALLAADLKAFFATLK
jgi:pimeloyl-ACP methyl ester carboxylesterase